MPITSIVITDNSLTMDLKDSRSISVPLAWYPRLLHGTSEERNKEIGNSEGIY